jgi:hypothetical protein
MITFALANYIEAGWWASVGVGMVLYSRRHQEVGVVPSVTLIEEKDPHPASPAGTRERGRKEGDAIIAGVVFFVFGGWGVGEAHTGAWWRPWWLLAWKGLCLLALVVLLVRYYKRKRREG